MPIPCTSSILKIRHFEKATNLQKSPTCFDKTAVFTQWCQTKWEIFSNFCGLLRKAELYCPNLYTVMPRFLQMQDSAMKMKAS